VAFSYSSDGAFDALDRQEPEFTVLHDSGVRLKWTSGSGLPVRPVVPQPHFPNRCAATPPK
jgi:hypothetical protein